MSTLIAWLGVFLTLSTAAFAIETTNHRIFSIKRSLNSNEVIYEAQMTEDGFWEKRPIKAHWVMHTLGGTLEDLTAIEQQLAYGVTIKKFSPNEVVFSLKALPGRSITVRRGSGQVSAITQIDDEESVLESVFIQHEAGGLIPSISFVDIAGVSVSQSTPVSEHYTP